MNILNMKGFKALKIELEFPRYYIIGDKNPKTSKEDAEFVWKLAEYCRDKSEFTYFRLSYGVLNIQISMEFCNLAEYLEFQKHFPVQNVS